MIVAAAHGSTSRVEGDAHRLENSRGDGFRLTSQREDKVLRSRRAISQTQRLGERKFDRSLLGIWVLLP
jgi:hypothetical protein